MLKKIGLLSVCVATIGVAGFAVIQYGQPSKTLVNRHAFAVSGPANPTSAEVAAFHQAIRNGTPLPSGWSIAADEGQVKTVDTGLVLQPSGERAWSVTIVDEIADLSTATVYLDDEEVYTATRANGGIVDRVSLNKAVATLPVLVPPASQSFDLKVTWVANDGTTVRESGATIP